MEREESGPIPGCPLTGSASLYFRSLAELFVVLGPWQGQNQEGTGHPDMVTEVISLNRLLFLQGG